MVQWNLFRGKLRRALKDTDPEMAEIEEDKLTPHDVEALTRGGIDAEVLTAYLKSERDDLPPEYVSRLLEMKELDLSAPDYRGPNSSATIRSSRAQSPAQIAARRVLQDKYDAGKAMYRPRDVDYASLDCDDGDAMRRAFRDRIHRAGISIADLGRKFNLTMEGATKSNCREINHFLEPLRAGPRGEAPQFPYKFQERFWEICAFLNESIHNNENPDTASLPGTGQFVFDLLKEGTARYPERAAEVLQKLNAHALKHTVPGGQAKR
jgi:hypothetical protein